MFFNAGQTQGAVGSVIPAKSGGQQPSQHLNQQQFGGKPAAPGDGREAGAGVEAGAEGAAAAGGAEAGAAGLADLAPLLLL